METAEIDTTNDLMIGGRGEEIVIMLPKQRLNHAEALRAAAYLVLMTGDYDMQEFDKVFKAVASS